MDKNYYREYFYYERENWWFKVRYEIIRDSLKRRLQKQSGLEILNIGAATGRSTEILQDFGNVTSVEYDEECCRFTRELTDLKIQQGTITALDFPDNSFDLVCAFDVIEHVDDDRKGVEEMFRVLKPGGHVLITVPAFMSMWSRHDEINHHFRRYTATEISLLFEPKFLTVHKTYFNTFLFAPIYLFRIGSKLIFRPAANNSKSDFTVLSKKSLINPVLEFVFRMERLLLRFLRFPFGVSYMYMGKK